MQVTIDVIIYITIKSITFVKLVGISHIFTYYFCNLWFYGLPWPIALLSSKQVCTKTEYMVIALAAVESAVAEAGRSGDAKFATFRQLAKSSESNGTYCMFGDEKSVLLLLKMTIDARGKGWDSYIVIIVLFIVFILIRHLKRDVKAIIVVAFRPWRWRAKAQVKKLLKIFMHEPLGEFW